MEFTYEYQNTSFLAHLNDQTEPRLLFTPSAFYEKKEGICGVAVEYRLGHDYIFRFSIHFPLDMVTCWRATVILQALKIVDEDSPRDAYYSAMRHKPVNGNPPWMYRSRSLVEVIGKEEHDRIMAMPIPELVIRGILTNMHNANSLGRKPIFEEMLAGTIQWYQWKQEFEELGIPHPQTIAPEILARTL